MENIVNPGRWRKIEAVGYFADTSGDAKRAKIAIGKLVESTASDGVLTVRLQTEKYPISDSKGSIFAMLVSVILHSALSRLEVDSKLMQNLTAIGNLTLGRSGSRRRSQVVNNRRRISSVDNPERGGAGRGLKGGIEP